ncbi:MAG: hypothetical protein R3A79_27450 [Nannocystaceae bacterium]
MPERPPKRARTRGPQPSAAQQAAIRHVRWLVGRALNLGRAPLRAASGARARRVATPTTPDVTPPTRGEAGPLVARRRALGSRLRRAWTLSRRASLRVAGALCLVAAHLSRGLLALGRGLALQRVALLGLLQRGLWWAALALFLVGGRDLLRPYDGTLADALPYFIVGFALCALALLVANTRRIRWAALALGFGHGALGVLLWTVLQG